MKTPHYAIFFSVLLLPVSYILSSNRWTVVAYTTLKAVQIGNANVVQCASIILSLSMATFMGYLQQKKPTSAKMQKLLFSSSSSYRISLES